MRVLVVCAVEAERDAVVRNFGAVRPVTVDGFSGVAVDTAAGELRAFSVGVGPVAAAIGTSALIAGMDYDLVASAGIAGGFRGRVAIGDVVLANLATYADLGVRVDDGFLSVRDLGIDQDSSLAFGDQRLIDRMSASGVLVGEVLTLSAMTGTDADAEELAARYPSALAEAMEGFAVVAATRDHGGIRYVAEIRAISNLIGRRDRSTWNIPLAFDALADAMSTLLNEPLP
ncbi:MAG TPA: futalosine hydrolase [Acidothermaceae bacterium]